MKHFLSACFGIFAGALITAACTLAPDRTENDQWEEFDPALSPSRGVNFSAWFEAAAPESIPFTKYTEQDFINVKSLGAGLVRLPIRMHSMTSGSPSYTLDPLYLELLDTVVDWAEKHEIKIILDNHSFDPIADTANDIGEILVPVWTQTAEHFKDRSGYVLYEILNEPHGIGAARWGEIQKQVIAAIRTIDTVHAIIVGGVEYNSINALASLPVYDDDNLIYTFHFYDPYVFTHQGENWGSPPTLANLKGVPFPYGAHSMPVIPNELKESSGSWVEGNLNYSYANDSKTDALAASLDKAVAFSAGRGNVPLFCGEFGAYMINSLKEDRVRWYKTVTKLLSARNIMRTSWDYYGGFGLFNTTGGGNFNSDLNEDVVRALGFNPPAQKTQEKIKTGFVIYDDYPGPGISASFWGQEHGAVFNLYASPAAAGKYSIRWGNAALYDAFLFEFNNSADWDYLKSQGGKLQFKAKTEQTVQFDVRFLDTENNSGIPWRMRYTIDEKILPSDGAWHTISIPLKDMTEHGAWVNATQKWLNPTGSFSWDKIESLQFAAEDFSLETCSIWFDDIQILK
ncbi:MAG: glycoside hydrolase family 5 protein [Treponema sp.]|jgi:endoglucanase|nr:glycoside hydrolase family 5 protein [Treponema sp.]